MKAKEIRDLIDFISKSGLNEVNIETDEFKISVKKNPDIIQSPHQVSIPNPIVHAIPSNETPKADMEEKTVAEQPSESAVLGNLIEIKAPMIGTFYRAPSPDADPYVEVGDIIRSGQTLCIIEAMKLFNEIDSEVSGKLVKILVENATPVEFDQTLFLVEPA